ncbi:N-formylglutamate amidohydrolase [Erythrobacter sp. JK5]|nr:N-formylglutamate amidohydrolase [Erythrobacter sp. JK5]
MVSSKGGKVAGDKQGPAFTHVAPRSMPLPVLIAVPHAGRVYPGDTLADMRDPDLCQLRLEDRHADRLGVEVAKQTGTGLLVAHAPRAMLDLNRAQDDIDWDMIAGSRRRGPSHSAANRRARSGLGLVPRRLPGFGEIWRQKLPQSELEARIENIHRPYHGFLAQELERIRDAWGAALLVDLHSMPPLRAQGEQSRAPQIVIGDRFGASCHSRLVARAFRCLDEHRLPVAHNRPYSGGYVLDRHSDPRRGLHAVQIEVCRSAYLDNRLSEPGEGLLPLAALLSDLVRELGVETARLGAGDDLAQAAE